MVVYTVLARDLQSPTNVWVHATYDNSYAAKTCLKDLKDTGSIPKNIDYWLSCPHGTELLMF